MLPEVTRENEGFAAGCASHLLKGAPGRLFCACSTTPCGGLSYGMHWALRNRASFAGHDRATQWDQLQRLYFSSYAMWNSLTTPFLFAQPGGGIHDCFEDC